MINAYNGLNFSYQKLMGQYESFQAMYEHAVEKEMVSKREEDVRKWRPGRSKQEAQG